MKNFTKKLALLLVFAMVLGVVSPTIVAKATENRKIFVHFDKLYFMVGTDESNAITDYDYTQYVGSTAPAKADIEKIKDKDWVTLDSEIVTDRKADLSWFNKKKASYIVVRIYENNAYTYLVSDKIEAQEDAFKVLYVQEAEAAATNKTPAYTSAQAVGTAKTGYFVFYTGKGTSMKVITPSAIDYRLDGTYSYSHVIKGGKTLHEFQLVFNRLIAKGGTLQFVQSKSRHGETGSASTNYFNDYTGWPSNKEVKYKISAQKAAPTVKLDITHVIPLKSGQEYRIVDTVSKKKSGWVSVDDAHGTTTNGKVKVGKILLEELLVATDSAVTAVPEEVAAFAANGKLKGDALATGNVKIQVRTAANTKGVASKIYSVVVTEAAIGTAASTAALNVTTGVDVAIAYKVSYDATKGITIKNNNTADTYEYCLTTSGASVTATDKWTSVKPGKSVDIKAANLKTKDGKDYTNIHVRKVGDKKNGILSSKAYTLALEGLEVVEQKIKATTGTGSAISGVTGAYFTATTAGAVTVTIPKALVSGAAVAETSIDVEVEKVTNPGTLKWASKGSAKKFTVAVPTFANNKVTFKFKVDKDATGDSGEYKCAVEGLNFTFKIVIGN
jgi:hypothetical protein